MAEEKKKEEQEEKKAESKAQTKEEPKTQAKAGAEAVAATSGDKADKAGKAEKADDAKKPAVQTAKDLLSTDVQPVKRTKVKGSKNIPVGVVHIRATFNNTQVSITDTRGNMISWSSSGRCGFKGSRKSTAYAATMVAQEAARQAIGHGMHEVEVKVQGPGAGRESAIRAVQAAGLTVTAIRDVTPIPHNGCRPPKRRRV